MPAIASREALPAEPEAMGGELRRVSVPRWCIREVTGEAAFDDENLAFEPYAGRQG